MTPTTSAPAETGDIDALLEAFAAQWKAGGHPLAESYLDGLDDDAAVLLAYQEFCLRESYGQAADPAAFADRFPRIRDRLGRLLGLHDAFASVEIHAWLMSSNTRPGNDLPEVGDAFGPYLLLRPLGEGGFARVFLAEQQDLGGRLVVLKLANRDSAEPRLMARARHPYIVEILRHSGAAAEGTISWVAMPFLGGATLADVLAEQKRSGRRPRTGNDLLDLLDRVAAPEYRATALLHPARELLATMSAPKAIAWIVARLASALGHAYAMGVTHGDLKPSNVLLTAEGVPMLIDFNLAVDWRAPAEPSAGRESGTLAYMAPERLRALAAPAQARPPRAADRHRADLYALGLLLREALTGTPPRLPGERPRATAEIAAQLADLRAREPIAPGRDARSIPAGLLPILAHCLAPDPDDRYLNANQLAEDLDRWRTDRRTIHAPSPSRSAGLLRWARRRRLPIAAAGITLAAGIAAAGITHGWGHRTIAGIAAEKFDLTRADSGLAGSRFLLPGRWRASEEGDPVALAERRLDFYGARTGGDWRERPDVRALSAADREDLEAWILEQAIRLSRAVDDRGEDLADVRRATAVLDHLAAIRPASAIVAEAARGHRRLGDVATLPAEAGEPVPAWLESYLRGVSDEDRHPIRALDSFRTALDARPDSFRARLKTAHLEGRLGHHAAAAANLARCVALSPKAAWLRLELAKYLEKADQHGESAAQYDAAVQLDPNLATAYLARGMVRARAGQPREGFADLERYRRLTASSVDGASQSLSSALNLITDPRGTVDPFTPPAKPSATTRDDEIPNIDQAIQNAWDRQAMDDPVGALVAWEQIVRLESENLTARFYRAINLEYLGRTDEAREEYEALLNEPRLAELFAHCPEATRIYQVVGYARLKSRRDDDALRLAEAGLAVLDRLPRSARPRNLQGYLNYLAANAIVHQGPEDDRIAAYLLQAREDLPDFLVKFATDDAFDAHRDRRDGWNNVAGSGF